MLEFLHSTPRNSDVSRIFCNICFRILRSGNNLFLINLYELDHVIFQCQKPHNLIFSPRRCRVSRAAPLALTDGLFKTKRACDEVLKKEHKNCGGAASQRFSLACFPCSPWKYMAYASVLSSKKVV